MRIAVALLLLGSLAAVAQKQALDPTRGVRLVSERDVHQPLPEQFIWIPGGPGVELKPDREADRYFRISFSAREEHAATLYIAGPNRVRAFLNGKPVAQGERDPKSKIRPFVVVAGVANALRAGRNVLAIEASHFPSGAGDIFGGHVPELAVKVVPAAEGVNAKPLVVSGPDWRGSLSAPPGWEDDAFDDSAWPQVQARGGIESDIARLQWNDDAALYRWPGYDGISPFLGHIPLPAQQVLQVDAGDGKLEGMNSLTGGSGEFTVTLGSQSQAKPPALVLDFGRETDGRLEIGSASDAPMKVELSYGESLEEAVNDPYLGRDVITVPAHGSAYGPKSAFRYARLRFLSGSSPLRFHTVRVDGIYYPVEYRGSFVSSDALLNRIWEVGAYTSHLCMVDDIWDAPKRDRARWMGDLDVSGRVIDTVFADQFLMKDTMDRLLADAGQPIARHVNTIPGYSAFWVMGQADFYRHLGDRDYLRGLHDRLLQLLAFMERDLDQQGLFVNGTKSWPFVDWSPGLSADTPETRIGNQFEFYKAFSDGAWMLSETGDSANSKTYETLAASMRLAANRSLLDAQTGTFGTRWQTNAMVIFSGAADDAQREAIWQQVLSRPSRQMISPYYNFYVIEAMAQSGHRREALDWIRRYWGGMVEQGATSFWEAYDPSWPKQDFHRHLQADNDSGYFVSLSHGWSSGPTAWLIEEVLGIQPLEPGFARVAIRPDLLGLAWARGAEPTPRGTISVDYRAGKRFTANIDVPAGVEARVSFPVLRPTAKVIVNGRAVPGTAEEEGTRSAITLKGPGKFQVTSE